MYSKEVTVINKTGLHARPASSFVQCATQFQSSLTVENLKSGKCANAKSIVMLLSLSLHKGTDIRITADGPDETLAVDTLTTLVSSGFDET